MASLTLYRPVGTVEVMMIAKGGWKQFPKMPDGFRFYAYSQPPGDLRDWPDAVDDIKMFEALEYGQEETVRSWQAWGNSPNEYYVVWFEIDEKFQLNLGQPLDVNAINQALLSPIEICARYEPAGIWKHPTILF